jgi:hypothetical protein
MFVTKLSRSWRALTFVILLLATLVFTVLVLNVIFYLAGLDSCQQGAATADRWICSNGGRWAAVLVVVAVGLRPMISWGNFLQRTLFAPNIGRQETVAASHQLLDGALGPTKLPLGQWLVAGPINWPHGTTRTAEIGGQTVTIWSDQALSSGRLKQGARVSLVYQQIPGLPTEKLALAYRSDASGEIRGIATFALSATSMMAALSLTWFAWIAARPSFLWAVICGTVLAVNLAYLGLVFRARKLLIALPR